MTRELLILRHAKSDWNTAAASDFERPLNDRGKRDAPRVGAWLAAQGWLPDHVVASPAKRAKATARKVCQELGVDPDAIDWQPRAYLADVPTLLSLLARCPVAAERVLLVGHNPGLEELLATLVGETLALPADGKLLPTAAVARLALAQEWAGLRPGCAELLALVRVRDLPSD
ncbi:MAG TPA: histidine phosphatase family protein [Gammaproteobacteria bacterium]